MHTGRDIIKNVLYYRMGKCERVRTLFSVPKTAAKKRVGKTVKKNFPGFANSCFTKPGTGVIISMLFSGYGSVWLERTAGGREVAGSNPVTPIFLCRNAYSIGVSAFFCTKKKKKKRVKF